MPLFAVTARDGDDMHTRRIEVRPAHLAYIDTIKGKIAVGGPLSNRAGEVIGSLLVVEAADEDEARALIAADPYFRKEVWQSPEIHALTAAVGNWLHEKGKGE